MDFEQPMAQRKPYRTKEKREDLFGAWHGLASVASGSSTPLGVASSVESVSPESKAGESEAVTWYMMGSDLSATKRASILSLAASIQ